MSFVTYLVEAEVRDERRTIEGKVYSRPALRYTDLVNVTYSCDVDIGQEGTINANGDIGIIPLRGVPIASNNKSLAYAEVGQAVTLTRDSTGSWEVSALSKTYPGTFNFVGVTITKPCHSFPLMPDTEVIPFAYVIGEYSFLSSEARLLTYGEIGSLGTYSITPYGAVGVYENGVLISIGSG